MTSQAPANVKSATLEAVIIRKDGTRVPLGVIGRYDANEPAWVRAVRRIFRRLIP
jgi:hypothetical protein